MLEIFKGQMTINEILHVVPYKILLIIRDERIKRLKSEREEMDKLAAQQAELEKKNSIRNQILTK